MELGHLSEVAQPGVTDIAVTCDGSVWVDGGDGMRLRRLHVPFDSAQSIRISRYDYVPNLAAVSTTPVR